MQLEYTTEMKLALDILNKKGYLWTGILATTSAPLICNGDMICMKIPNDNLKIGDLVATTSHKMFIVQRIIEISGSKYRTKADISEKGPFEFAREDIIARVVMVSHQGTIININNKISARINRNIARLSIKRTVQYDNSGFFYRPFFQNLRRSFIKRLLKLVKITGKTDEKNLDPEIQVR